LYGSDLAAGRFATDRSGLAVEISGFGGL